MDQTVQQTASLPEIKKNPKRNWWITTTSIFAILWVLTIMAWTTDKANQNVRNVLNTALTPYPTVVTATPIPSKTITITLNPSQEWAPYTDNWYGFTFSIPPGWRVIESSGASNRDQLQTHYLLLNPIHRKPGDPFSLDITINFYANPNHLSASDFVKQVAFKNDLPGWDNTKQPTYPVTLKNIGAVKLNSIVGGKGEFGPDAFIVYRDIVINILADDGNQVTRNYFDQILSTFKFD